MTPPRLEMRPRNGEGGPGGPMDRERSRSPTRVLDEGAMDEELTAKTLSILEENQLDKPGRLAVQLDLGRVDFHSRIATAVGLPILPQEANDLLDTLCDEASTRACLSSRDDGAYSSGTRSLVYDATDSGEKPFDPVKVGTG